MTFVRIPLIKPTTLTSVSTTKRMIRASSAVSSSSSSLVSAFHDNYNNSNNRVFSSWVVPTTLTKTIIVTANNNSTSRYYHTNGYSAAAATKREKRGLTVEEHGVSSSDATVSGTASTTGAAAASTDSGSSLTLPLAAVGAIVLGGGAYYYYTTKTKNSNTTPKEEEVVTEATTEAAVASSVEAKAIENTTAKVESTEITATEDTTSSSSGHRVISIAVPDKMKNIVKVASQTSISHPIDGNRVTTIVPKSNATGSDEASGADATVAPSKKDWNLTDEALEKLKSSIRSESIHELVQSYQHPLVATSSSSSLTSIDTSKLEKMTVGQLQFTIVQLQKELQERTKWEAIRLKEFLLLQEKDISNKYADILQKQRLEYEDTIAKKLREREHEISVLYNQQLQHKDATVQAVIQSAVDALNAEHESDKRQSEELLRQQIQTALDEEYSTQMDQYKQRIQQDLQQKVALLQALQEKIQALETSLEASKISREGSTKAHRLSAAALALTEVLETDQGAAKELQLLKYAAGKEGVISTAVATIPEAAVKQGIPTVSQLQARFRNYVYKKCRQAALVPNGRYGIEGQIAGIVFAALKYAPEPNEPVDDETVLTSPEYIVERIQNLISTGNIETAVDEIDKLPPDHQTTFVLQDWKRDAIHRIAIDKALKVIKMECALLNESCL